MGPDETAQLRRLLHELSEALTAAGAFLHAGGQIHDLAVLQEALNKAQDQIKRADEVVVRLRALVSAKGD